MNTLVGCLFLVTLYPICITLICSVGHTQIFRCKSAMGVGREHRLGGGGGGGIGAQLLGYCG